MLGNYLIIGIFSKIDQINSGIELNCNLNGIIYGIEQYLPITHTNTKAVKDNYNNLLVKKSFAMKWPPRMNLT